MIPQWLQLLALIASPIFAAGGAYAAVRVKLEWHAQRLDKCEARLDHHDELLRFP